ncbi:MAG: DUF6569 family protein [Candidatus Hydrothermales bacterium]
MMLKNLNIGEPVFQRNLLLFPLYRGENGDGELIIKTIEDAYNEGFGGFRELERPNIEKVIFENRGSYPVFAIDGEQVLGAFQNRVINTAFFSEPNTVIEVPVTCVEERRWGGKRNFDFSSTTLYPSLRALLLKTTNKSLILKNSFISDQKLVWENIRKTLTSLNVYSKTLSIQDAFNIYESQINWYLDGVNFDNACGIIAFAGPNFLCMDLFVSKSLFLKFKEKILKGYALDAILLREYKTDFVEKDRVKEIIEKVKRLRIREYKGLGNGVELRGEGEGLILRGFKKERDKILHLAIFPDFKL